jgi:Tripartite tricarboxylate transporter TctB family
VRVVRIDRAVLLVLALLALAAGLVTPWLITPFPTKAPWYESAATFPRVALAVAALAALAECWLRRGRVQSADSDELDTRAAQLPLALKALLLFIAYAALVPVLGFMVSTFVFVLACGLVIRLRAVHAWAMAVGLALALWAIFAVGLKVAFGHGWLI